MKSVRKLSGYIIFGAVFCVLYIFIAVKPLGKELQFEPEWKIDVTNPVISENSENEVLLPFKLGQSIGYFTQSGKVINFVSFPQKASISSSLYTTYSLNNTSAKIMKSDKTQLFETKVSGFPMICNDHVFTFLPGGSSFVMHDDTGKVKWEYTGAIPLTAFSCSSSSVCAGFADGNICLFDTDGKLLLRFAPGGSEIPVILGLDVSSDGNYIASLCGHNRQRFILAKKDGLQAKIVYHCFLDSKSTNQMLVKFNADNSAVYFNAGDTFGVVDVKSGKKSTFNIEGNVLSVQEAEKCFFVLSKDDKNYSVYVVEPFATYLGKFSFTADSAFIKVYKDNLYVGKDSTISCIKIK